MSGSEWAVVAGAAIGGIVTLCGAVLTDFLAGRKQEKIDKARKKLLRTRLKGAIGDGWMHIETLAQIVGADLDSTRALLIDIQARGSMKTKKETWSLISRNPLPTSNED
jgi:hypothetical protein